MCEEVLDADDPDGPRSNIVVGLRTVPDSWAALVKLRKLVMTNHNALKE